MQEFATHVKACNNTCSDILIAFGTICIASRTLNLILKKNQTDNI